MVNSSIPSDATYVAPRLAPVSTSSFKAGRDAGDPGVDLVDRSVARGGVAGLGTSPESTAFSSTARAAGRAFSFSTVSTRAFSPRSPSSRSIVASVVAAASAALATEDPENDNRFLAPSFVAAAPRADRSLASSLSVFAARARAFLHASAATTPSATTIALEFVAPTRRPLPSRARASGVDRASSSARRAARSSRSRSNARCAAWRRARPIGARRELTRRIDATARRQTGARDATTARRGDGAATMLRRAARAARERARTTRGAPARSMQLSAFDGDKTRKTRATAEEMAREAEQMEELSVFRAVSGLVAAAAGGGLVFALGAGAVAGVASGLASALGMVRDGKAQRERERDRETLRYELSMASGWGRQARRRRADIQAKLDALGD
jgi:hypothetical protein